MSDALPPPRSTPETIEELARLAEESVATNEALSAKQQPSGVSGANTHGDIEGEKVQNKQRRKRTTYVTSR